VFDVEELMTASELPSLCHKHLGPVDVMDRRRLDRWVRFKTNSEVGENQWNSLVECSRYRKLEVSLKARG